MIEIPILTLDIDWAPDFVISDIMHIFKKNNIRSTWFATHNSPIIDKLMNDKLFEIGIHPNFLENTSHGKTPREILTNMKKSFPNAKSIRTHSLFQSTPVLALFHKFGIKNDVSLFLENSSHISPFYSNYLKLYRFPYFWEDDVMMYKKYDWSDFSTLKNISGLKIFNFHPIHIFLNSCNMNSYKQIKNNIGLSNLTSKNIQKFINKKNGTKSLFLNLIDFLKGKPTYTINDLQKQMRNKTSKIVVRENLVKFGSVQYKKNLKINLSAVTKFDIEFLYELMLERPNYPAEFQTPISELPTFLQHKKFTNNFLEDNKKNSYEGWYIINLKRNSQNEKVGAVVLKKDGEWGYHILMKYWDQGFGTIAIKKLFSLNPKMKFWGRCKAGNKRAIHQFEKLGFTLTTLTFEKLN